MKTRLRLWAHVHRDSRGFFWEEVEFVNGKTITSDAPPGKISQPCDRSPESWCKGWVLFSGLVHTGETR